jgi:hypothetical protein
MATLDKSSTRPASLVKSEEAPPRAFYLLSPGGWHDYVNLLHAPYTTWHLSYVALGAGLAMTPDYALLGWTLLAFFLAMGVGAHALDEWHDHPLQTTIPDKLLLAIGLVSLMGALAIGLTVGLRATLWLWPCIVLGAWLVVAYDLEWGPFHHDLVFAVAWGAFPLLTSFLAQTASLSLGSIALAGGAAGLSYAQRVLSKRVRLVRREVAAVKGDLEKADGTTLELSRAWLVQPDDLALLVLSGTVPLLAVGLLLK